MHIIFEMIRLEQQEKLLTQPLVFNIGSNAGAQIPRQAQVALPSNHFTIHLSPERDHALNEELHRSILAIGAIHLYWPEKSEVRTKKERIDYEESTCS